MKPGGRWLRGACLAAVLLTAPFFHRRLAAQEPTLRLTMDEAVRRALASGEEVHLAQATVDQARGQVRQAYSSALPELRASFAYTRTFASIFSGASGPAISPFEPDTNASLADRVRYLEDEYPLAAARGLGALFANTPFGSENTYTASLTLGQVLFQGGKVAAGVRGARAYERAATSQLDEARHDLTYRVKHAYLGALFAQRLHDIAVEGKALVDSQLARVQLNHTVGSAADYDLLRAQVEAANQEPAVIGARNQRDLAMLELRRLVNVPVTQPVELDAALLAATASLPEVDWSRVELSESDRAMLAAADASVEFRRQAVRVYSGDAYPTLRFDMAFGGQAFPSGAFPGYGDFRRDWNARLTVSMPIFDGFRTRGAVMQARAEVHRAEAQLAQTREAVLIEVEQARAEVVRARALLEARRQTVQWGARAHHLATVRYANGIATALEVSDARLAMQQAQVNEAQAMRDYLLGVAGLERALGRSVPVRSVETRAGHSGTAAQRHGQDTGGTREQQ